MKTLEIKKYIKERVSDGGDYTPQDFYQYIVENYGKNFTKGQLSGAIAQLLDKGELVKAERGVYRTAYKTSESDKSENINITSKFISEILICLTNTNKELSKITSRVDVLNMSREEFALLSEVKHLKEELEIIVKTYK